MLKIIERLVIALTIIFIMYFVICYADVLMHNLDPDAHHQYPNWNVFQIMRNYNSAQ